VGPRRPQRSASHRVHEIHRLGVDASALPGAGFSDTAKNHPQIIEASIRACAELKVQKAEVLEQRKLEALTSSGSAADRKAELETLEGCEPPAKKAKADDEPKFFDPKGECSCSCHKHSCGTCKKYFFIFK